MSGSDAADAASTSVADLAYIRRVLEATRAATFLSGTYYLLWGCVVGAGLVMTWLQVTGRLPGPAVVVWWIWGSLSVVGWLGTGLLIRRGAQIAPAVGHAAHQMGMIWAAFGVTTLLLYFVGAGTGTLPVAALSGLMALTMGLALWAVGLIAGIRWFRNLAGLWWLAGALMLAWPGTHALLFLAAMMLLLFALPGWWLARGVSHPV